MIYRRIQSRTSHLRLINPVARILPALLFLALFSCASVAQESGPRAVGNINIPRAGNIESWTNLSLQGSELVPDTPFVGEKDDLPQFTRELIQVKWRAGDPIDLYVIKPKGVVKPGVVLYLYSYPSETERFRDDRYCTRVTKDGFAAIGFVSALTGHRYQDRPMKEWFISELQEALATSVHDVQMVLNYLGTRDDLDMSRVGMFGAGSGGTIAILAATVEPRIKAIDLLDPWGDWPDWMPKSALIPEEERARYVTPEFLKKIAPLDPAILLPQLKSQQVRLQHVMDDDVTPKEAKAKIESAAGSSTQLVRYEDTRQLFMATSGGRLFEWLKVHLGSGGAPAVHNAQGESSMQTKDGARSN